MYVKMKRMEWDREPGAIALGEPAVSELDGAAPKRLTGRINGNGLNKSAKKTLRGQLLGFWREHALPDQRLHEFDQQAEPVYRTVDVENCEFREVITQSHWGSEEESNFTIEI